MFLGVSDRIQESIPCPLPPVSGIVRVSFHFLAITLTPSPGHLKPSSREIEARAGKLVDQFDLRKLLLISKGWEYWDCLAGVLFPERV